MTDLAPPDGFDLPPGATSGDPRWQTGYADADDNRRPTSADPVYVSGWMHGLCEAWQTGREEAARVYAKGAASTDEEWRAWL